MGLYDYDNSQGALNSQSGGMLDPNNQAMLAMAAGLLQAGGASPMPVGLGQAFGQGISKSMEAYKAAQQEQMQRLMMQQQMNKLQKDTQAQEMFNKMYSGGTPPALGGTQQNPSLMLTDAARANLPNSPQGGPSLDDIGRLMGVDVERGKAALLLWQQQHPDVKWEGGVPLNPKTGQPLTNAPIIPQTNQQGFSTQLSYGPGGFNVGVTPGSIDAFKQQQREQNRYSFEPVKQASGATVPVSRVDLAEGRWPQGAVGAPAPTAQPPVQAPKPTLAPIKNDPWSKIPMRFEPRGVGQSTYSEKLSGAQAEMATKLQEKFGEEATANGQRMALNNQALEMLDKSDTGTGAASLADVKKVLVTRFGIPESSFENTPSATAILQKDLMNAAVQKAKQSYGQRMTQMEVTQMLSKGAPNVDMTKAAIKYLLDADNATMKYGIQRSADIGRYIQAGGDPHRFESWYANNFPATNDLNKVRLGRPPLSAFQK